MNMCPYGWINLNTQSSALISPIQRVISTIPYVVVKLVSYTYVMLSRKNMEGRDRGYFVVLSEVSVGVTMEEINNNKNKNNPPTQILSNCYVIHLNASSFVIIFAVFAFLWNFGSKITMPLYVSQHFSSFSSLRDFFVFALARRWNISCTAIDSPYVCRWLLWLFFLSRTEGRFNRE